MYTYIYKYIHIYAYVYDLGDNWLFTRVEILNLADNFFLCQ